MKALLLALVLTACAGEEVSSKSAAVVTCETVCVVMNAGTAAEPNWDKACLTVRDPSVYSELWWQNVREVYETRACDDGPTYELLTWVGVAR